MQQRAVPLPMREWEVQAILEGRKTQFRRVIRPQPTLEQPWLATGDRTVILRWKDRIAAPLALGRDCLAKYAPYQAGDLIWVQERWRPWGHDGCEVLYWASASMGLIFSDRLRWRAPCAMARQHSRILLRVSGLDVGLLQDVTERSARAEGVRPAYAASLDIGVPTDKSYREGFCQQWELDHGEGTWAENRWVWAPSFEVVEIRR